MIENFLRTARRPVEVAADVLRGAGALSVVLAAVFFDLRDAGIIAFALPGLFFPRFLGMKPWADIVFESTVLVAAWSNVFDLYTRISWWDLVVHFMCTGVLSAGVYLLLAQLRFVPAPAPRSGASTMITGIVFTTTFGLAMSALWEMIEWFGREYISDRIYTAYDDTIGDMALGGLGALGAGFAIACISLLRSAQRGASAVRTPGPR
ncbi:hypothetical protein IV500_13215 [Paeniglutamicibacter antarcticus]|uniref:DUF2238 domain-containing protein n=1 Tax=Arthrobacter terrae TaxID=2935737 RepID=A0A931CPV3_9MICC|nr:hypothetical protein [Arthrobacter terrae]MBG0740340.1 hypothetical protein [Arthrobacter terrae]